MFSTKEFKEWTEKVIPFAHITTRVPGDPDQGLLYDKGGRGFPTLAFLDAEGRMVARQGQRTVDGFDETLQGAVQDFFALEKRAKSDPAARDEFLKRQVELGQIDDFAKMRKRIEASKLSDGDKAGLMSQLDGWYMSKARAAGADGKLTRALEMADAIIAKDQVPTGRGGLSFWGQYGRWAADSKDRKRLQRAIQAVDDSDARGKERTLQTLKQLLEQL